MPEPIYRGGYSPVNIASGQLAAGKLFQGAINSFKSGIDTKIGSNTDEAILKLQKLQALDSFDGDSNAILEGVTPGNIDLAKFNAAQSAQRGTLQDTINFKNDQTTFQNQQNKILEDRADKFFDRDRAAEAVVLEQQRYNDGETLRKAQLAGVNSRNENSQFDLNQKYSNRAATANGNSVLNEQLAALQQQSNLLQIDQKDGYLSYSDDGLNITDVGQKAIEEDNLRIEGVRKQLQGFLDAGTITQEDYDTAFQNENLIPLETSLQNAKSQANLNNRQRQLINPRDGKRLLTDAISKADQDTQTSILNRYSKNITESLTDPATASAAARVESDRVAKRDFGYKKQLVQERNKRVSKRFKGSTLAGNVSSIQKTLNRFDDNTEDANNSSDTVTQAVSDYYFDSKLEINGNTYNKIPFKFVDAAINRAIDENPQSSSFGFTNNVDFDPVLADKFLADFLAKDPAGQKWIAEDNLKKAINKR